MGEIFLMSAKLACELVAFLRELLKLMESTSSGGCLREKLARRKH